MTAELSELLESAASHIQEARNCLRSAHAAIGRPYDESDLDLFLRYADVDCESLGCKIVETIRSLPKIE